MFLPYYWINENTQPWRDETAWNMCPNPWLCVFPTVSHCLPVHRRSWVGQSSFARIKLLSFMSSHSAKKKKMNFNRNRLKVKLFSFCHWQVIRMRRNKMVFLLVLSALTWGDELRQGQLLSFTFLIRKW